MNSLVRVSVYILLLVTSAVYAQQPSLNLPDDLPVSNIPNKPGFADLPGILGLVPLNRDNEKSVIPDVSDSVYWAAWAWAGIEPGADELIDYLTDGVERKKNCELAALYFIRDTSNLNYENYANSCGVVSLESLASNNSMLQSYMSRLGVLYDSEGIYCSGIIIDATSILTARHCLRDKFRFQWFDGEVNNVISSFRSISPGCTQALSSELIEQACDYVTLVPSAPIDGVNGSVPISTRITPFKKLYVIGFSPYQQRQNDFRIQFRHVSPWPQAIVGTENPLCIAHTVSSKEYGNDSDASDGHVCLLHGCQTVSAMSGSPILYEQNGELKLYGVHIGSNYSRGDRWADQNDCGFEVTSNLDQQSNIGVGYAID